MRFFGRYLWACAWLAIPALLSVLAGCKGVAYQGEAHKRNMAKTGTPHPLTPIPLIVKSLIGVLIGKHPTVADLARPLAGRVVKDDTNSGYQVQTVDDRYEKIYVTVSASRRHPHQEEIDGIELWLKPGRAPCLSALSRVFGKPSGARIQTAVAPGPDSIRLGRYSEIITVGFPDVPGSGDDRDSVKNPIQLGLSARLAHNPGPDFPDPPVNVVQINREDLSDIF